MSVTRVDKIAPLQKLDLELVNLLIAQVNSRIDKLQPSPAAQPTQKTLTLSPTGGIVSNFPLGRGTWFKLATPAVCQLTGLAGGYEGRFVVLHNTSSATITLPEESTASTPSNRINSRTGGGISLGSNAAALICYDGFIQRWMYITNVI